AQPKSKWWSKLKKLFSKKESGESESTEETPEEPPSQAQSRTGIIRKHTDVSFPASVPIGKVYNLRVQIVPAEIVLPSGEVRELPKPHSHDVTMDLDVP